MLDQRPDHLDRLHHSSPVAKESADDAGDTPEPPPQAGRLAEIRSNLDAQVVEAERNQWLGDVDQLRLTIKHADRKSDELNRRLATEQPTLIVAEHAQGAQ